MKKFELKVIGTEEYIEKSKEEIKKLYEEGKEIDVITEEVFKSFPKDTKEMISKDLKAYFSK